MKPVTVGEHTVDRCTGCSGLWFDLREHEHIAESQAAVEVLDVGDPAEGARQNAKRDVACPHCTVKMLKLSVPKQLHIQYESCPVCHGAFFDAGEFKDYASHTLAEQVANFFGGFRRRVAKP
jgi:Zn-finger nucleic acid-binding protein